MICVILGQPWKTVIDMAPCQLLAILAADNRVQAQSLRHRLLAAGSAQSGETLKIASEEIQRLTADNAPR